MKRRRSSDRRSFTMTKAWAVMCCVLIVSTSACSNTPQSGQSEFGKTAISRWKDGKQAAYLLAFDDEAPTQLDVVVPELQRRNIVGTFYVIPGNPRWTVSEDRWLEAAKSPFVVLANHTFTHEGVGSVEDLDIELRKCNEILYSIYGTRPRPFLLSFGQPGGVPWGVTPAEQAEALERNHLLERPTPFRGSPSDYTTKAQVISSVQNALSAGDVGYDYMHGVGGDWLPTPLDWFDALLDTIEAFKDRLWVPDVVSYSKYVAERDTTTIEVQDANDTEVRITLNTTLDSALYDYPLTFTTKVSREWTDVVVTQGSKSERRLAKDGVVSFDAVPGHEEVRLAPA